MSRKSADDKHDEIAFKMVNREIDLLLKRLRAKGVCPCCVAQGLMYRGAILHSDVAGPEDTVALCMEVTDSIKHPFEFNGSRSTCVLTSFALHDVLQRVGYSSRPLRIGAAVCPDDGNSTERFSAA